MPYFWGTVGIGYRRSAAEPTSWADMFASHKHAGRISLLDSIVSIQSALKYLRHSLNTDDPAKIDEAARVLIEAKPRIKEFAPDTGQDLLIVGEVDLCLEYNGDILQVTEEDDDLAYVVPEEGALLWEDTLCIPTNAPNPDGAYRFINLSSMVRSTGISPRSSATPARMRRRWSTSPRRIGRTPQSTHRARSCSAVRSQSTRARRSSRCTPMP